MKKFQQGILLLFLFLFFQPIQALAVGFIDYDNSPYLLEEATGKGVKVAVIDSGISKHPDLNITGGKGFMNGSDSFEDEHNHGTMVAGIIAGQKEGVAPGVELYGLKVLDRNASGNAVQMIEAVNWAIENDMDIINMSIIMDWDYAPLNHALKRAMDEGIIVIACAGNNGGIVTSPASVEGVISVGALDIDMRTKASFSSHIGKVDYWAKGTNIRSTNRHGGYDSNWYGTSFSAPYVTGIFALYKEVYPELTAEQLKVLVKENGRAVEGQSEWLIPQKPQYEQRGYLKLNGVNGKFDVKRVTRYYPISHLLAEK
jgi:minor extracellular protease Epr